MTIALLVLNLFCGLWNSIMSTTGSQLSVINAVAAAANWVAVGVLAFSLIR
ncbi:hypothetical protein pEaSNUABM56_00258 [Erwinia phage pEa_SNUABM_56]|uniref:Uncharacterized protein n=1 Tax=Erwinia phage pEp_SNUABM_01 TaxID=2601643 RepID=A0A5J6DBI7_9CAUD|nr:hypothetical protein HWC63_gp145 [Erwinia phage pEp_SNUABM_01]QEQ95033.1 hypothetical protein pEpSNUABM01_207 [Erwinia phage pEp_SNUABM_01]UYL84960.1 hypothetical protein pEaSNUABM55_00187 [Erwinia phage pEa_SNUABM_55]UYL85278.1 hypothetical protein pEaSNUABM56_00258 [Erwinia phage pEa_SNUABM_56]